METIVSKPNLYDLLYEDVVEDIALYLRLTVDYKTILEYGAGTGRVTIPLANAGHHVVALDLEKAMLEKLKSKVINDKVLSDSIEVVNGDMTKYISQQKFACIIIPLTSFNYLTTKEDQEACIKTLSDNLNKEGIAILELLSQNTFFDIDTNDKLKFIKKINLENGKYYEYWRNTILDMKSREITQRRLFRLFDSGNVKIDEEELFWQNRFVTIDDFKNLLKGYDLEIDKIYGDCQLGEYNSDSPDVFIKIKKL